MKMMQRMLALLLTGLLLVGLMPTQALAAQTEPTLPDVKTEEETVAEEPKLVYVKDLGYELGDGFYAKLVMTVDETQEKQELDDMEQGLTLSVTEDGKLKLEVKEFNFPDTISHKDKAYLFEDFTCEEAKTVTETGYKSGQDKPCTLSVTLTRDPKEHSGGQANCVELAKCEFCGKEYGTANDAHDFVTWANDGVSHWQICSRNEAHISQKMGLCSGGEATCAAKAVCEICGLPYGEAPAHSPVYASAPVDADSCTIIENCENCNHTATAVLSLTGKEFTYTGAPIEPGVVTYSDNWQGATLAVGYGDNLNVGNALCYVEGYEEGGLTFAIAPAVLTVKAADAAVVYGEDAPEFTFTYEGLLGDDTAADITGEVTFTCDYETGDAAGTYTIVASGELTAQNYTISFEPGTLTVGAQEPAYTAPAAKNDLTYNGQAQELIAAGSCEMGTVVYSLAENGEYTEAIPTGTNAGPYTVWYKVDVDETANPNYKDTAGSVEVTIGKAKLTPSIDGTASKTYDGTTDVTDNKLSIKLDGICGTDAVTATADFAYASANAGTKSVKATNIALNEAATANYALAATEAAADVGEITRLTVTEDAAITSQQIIWDGTEKTAALTSVKMNGLDVTYQLTGNKATDVGVHKMKLKATGNFQGELELEFYILPDEDILKGITNANVTSANQEAIDKAQEMVKEADTSGFPEEIKAAVDADLKTIGDNADALEERLEDAADAASTTNITKAKAITAAKAKDTDKKVLTDAKEDLEDALETYGTNYTAKEREAMEDEIERLEDIIADITAAEDTIKAIDALSENSTKAKVEAAQAMYDKLTAAQKKIVDNSTDGKLDEMQGLVGNYKVTSGDGRRWSKKSSGVLSFTCNGPLNKFTGIRVDGKAVLSKHYTYKEGSTIVTLKTTYLETLKLGNHTITFRYEDGEASATFTIQKEAVTPSTGDQFNIGLWAGIGGASVVALVVLLIIMKKKMK